MYILRGILCYTFLVVKNTKDGIVVNIKISPNAKKNEIIKDGDIIKVKITAQPVDGKANKALVEYLSKTFKVPKTLIKILKGETSKDKTILFEVFEEEKLRNITKVFDI